MFQTLMNNSITIIFVVTMLAIGFIEYRRYLKRTGITAQEFRASLRKRFNELGNELLLKLVAAIFITHVISLISFREIWMNDAFHIVFLTNVFYPRVVGLLKRLTLK